MEILAVGILPALIVVAWPLLWWRGSRKLRLWFAVLSPAALVAILMLSAAEIDRQRAASCLGPCRPDVRDFTAGLDATSWLGLSLTIGCLLALAIGIPLAIMTAVADVALFLHDRRH